MPVVTIEVPETLIQRLEPVRERLPEVLERGLRARPPLPAQVYSYILEFLAGGPTAKEVANFRPAPEMQARVSELLEKNRAGTLTEMEQAELDEYMRIEHLMLMIKAQAHLYLASALPPFSTLAPNGGAITLPSTVRALSRSPRRAASP